MKTAFGVLLAFLPALAQTRVDPPALPGSGMPYLASGPDGAVYLSWTDPLEGNQHALRFSRWTGSAWSPPETAAQGKRWFVNWGDFPSIAVLPGGAMLAHWLTRNEGSGKYGYGIRVARRDPGSSAWRQIHGMSLDEKEDYAGFLSFVPDGRGAIYLSPPSGGAPAGAAGHHDEHAHRKTARFTAFGPGGRVESDREVDPDTCSCCPTAIERTPSGLIAAYRDRLPGEIRDISIIRFVDGAWTSPQPVHRDGWRINACPTDGPAIATSGAQVAVVWLTRAQDVPRIQIALSADEGRTFAAPLRLDGGRPVGRPAIARAGDSGYLVTWLERTSEQNAAIRLRRVTRGGKAGPAVTVTSAAAGRSTGFPKIAATRDRILIAWRDERVRAVMLTAGQVQQQEQR